MIRLAAAHHDAIATAALAAYPHEACGLLIGRREPGGLYHITRVVDAPNIHPEPRHRFELDPRVQIHWLKRLRGGPEALLGHWHSHPDGPPEPSRIDAQMAVEDGELWLVVAVRQGQAHLPAGHRWHAASASFTRLDLELEKTP